MWQFIGFLSFNFAGMTWLNRMLEGKLISSDEIAIMNTLTITHEQSISGCFQYQ